MSDRVLIFDTTLRDGEQSPGASMNIEEKVEIALQLARLGVDVIEAGFPISSPGDFEGVRRVAQEVRGPVICGLARCADADIDRAGEALQAAQRARIHTFIATSDIHLQHKLRKTREQVLEMADRAVRRAREFTDDVEFSTEDATRSDVDYLCQVLEVAIRAGATTVNIPDTVGYTTPGEFAQLIRDIQAKVPSISRAVISVHCHNDLGLAVANSLAAVQAGARQVECTINGLGERAGNAALEEIVMAMRTRPQVYQTTTGIKTEEIYRTSRLVTEVTGILVQPNKAIVGSNAFAHEAGIHQHGVLSERSTYEIMEPASVGVVESKLVLGKHSGRHAFEARLKDLGVQMTREELDRAFQRFKALADKKKQVFDEDIEALVADETHTFPEEYALEIVTVTSAHPGMPNAAIRLRHGEETIQGSEIGVGSVDAVFKTIDALVPVAHELEDYTVKSITGGTDAMAEVTVKLRDNGRLYTGRGADLDIIVASARAYLQAINKLVYYRRERGSAVSPQAPVESAV